MIEVKVGKLAILFKFRSYFIQVFFVVCQNSLHQVIAAKVHYKTLLKSKKHTFKTDNYVLWQDVNCDLKYLKSFNIFGNSL